MISSKSIWLRLSFALAVLILAACASSQKVPRLKSDDLPAVEFKALSPRDLKVQIKNNRKRNMEAKNTAEAEKVVLDAITGAISRGGLKILDRSRNTLSVLVEDYDGTGPLGHQEGECVKVTGVLRAKWGSSIMATGFGCHQLKHWIGINLGGDVSQAYTFALRLMLDQLEKQQIDLLRGGRAL